MSHNISERMFDLAQKNSTVREMFEEGKRLAAIYGRDNVYDFSIGNPYFPPPEKVNRSIIEIVENEPSTLIHAYMSNSGYEDVREAVALNLNKRFGMSFGRNNIIMTAGAAGGLNVILRTLLNPGDEVLVLAPYFLEYGNYVANAEGVLSVVPANTIDFQPNAEVVMEHVSRKTKAVIINNPNNPSGVIYSEEAVKGLSAVLEKKQEEYGHAIYILSDEPYRELAYDGATVPWLPSYYRNTIVCYSWSKSLSLPGERIGYLAIPSEIDDYELVLTAAGIATRILGFVNAPSLFQRVVAECLDESTDIAAYDRNRRLLYKALVEAGFDCVYPQGTFYIWMKTPCDDKKFCETAKKHNILLVPGSSFACPGYVRIAYCVDEKTIKGSLPGFRILAGELSKLRE